MDDRDNGNRDARTARLGRAVATAASVAVVAALAGLFALQANAGAGRAAPPAGGTTSQREVLRPAALGDTPTSVGVVIAQATPTITPAPTSTPVPLGQPTPTPGPIGLSCLGAQNLATQGHPDMYRGAVCISAPAGATVNVQVSYCGSASAGLVLSGITIPNSGTYTDNNWDFTPGCAAPFTVTLNASGTTAAGDALAGSASFTVAS